MFEHVATKIYETPSTTIISDALSASNKPIALMIDKYLIKELNEGHNDNKDIHRVDKGLSPSDSFDDWFLSPHLVSKYPANDSHDSDHEQSFVHLVDNSEIQTASCIADKTTVAKSEGKRHSW